MPCAAESAARASGPPRAGPRAEFERSFGEMRGCDAGRRLGDPRAAGNAAAAADDVDFSGRLVQAAVPRRHRRCPPPLVGIGGGSGVGRRRQRRRRVGVDGAAHAHGAALAERDGGGGDGNIVGGEVAAAAGPAEEDGPVAVRSGDAVARPPGRAAAAVGRMRARLRAQCTCRPAISRRPGLRVCRESCPASALLRGTQMLTGSDVLSTRIVPDPFVRFIMQKSERCLL